MGLPTEDLQQIRSIMKEELRPVENALKAVEDEVRETYDILTRNNTKVV